MPKRLVLEFPVEFPEEGALNKKALKKGKEAVVLELLREGKISQGKAAELLEIDRHDLFDLMAKHDIPMADFPPEELKRQLEYAEKKGKKELEELIVGGFRTTPVLIKETLRITGE